MVTTYLDDLMTEQNIKCSSGDMTESQGPEVKKKVCVRDGPCSLSLAEDRCLTNKGNSPRTNFDAN